MYILIIIVGLILIVSNYKKVFNEENSFANEVKLMKKDELSIRLIELRSEMGESFLQEQQEIEELKNQFIKVNEDMSYLKENLEELNAKKAINKKHQDKKDQIDNERVEIIRGMLQEKMPIEDICHKTGAGKGEVLLIKELFPL